MTPLGGCESTAKSRGLYTEGSLNPSFRSYGTAAKLTSSLSFGTPAESSQIDQQPILEQRAEISQNDQQSIFWNPRKAAKSTSSPSLETRGKQPKRPAAHHLILPQNAAKSTGSHALARRPDNLHIPKRQKTKGPADAF